MKFRIVVDIFDSPWMGKWRIFRPAPRPSRLYNRILALVGMERRPDQARVQRWRQGRELMQRVAILPSSDLITRKIELDERYVYPVRVLEWYSEKGCSNSVSIRERDDSHKAHIESSVIFGELSLRYGGYNRWEARYEALKKRHESTRDDGLSAHRNIRDLEALLIRTIS